MRLEAEARVKRMLWGPTLLLHTQVLANNFPTLSLLLKDIKDRYSCSLKSHISIGPIQTVLLNRAPFTLPNLDRSKTEKEYALRNKKIFPAVPRVKASVI